ncbi:MAG: eL32 family ribosomal protein [Candidatus ainarchaeum sp.]|nr:eL32 family ribosomal protein [Candidatus ainarchaeum sp.]
MVEAKKTIKKTVAKKSETTKPLKQENKIVKETTKEIKTQKPIETEKKVTKKEEAKVEIKKNVKKIYIKKEKKANKTKSAQAKENQKKLDEKKDHPVFRGRFGKKNIRKKSIKKWQKWRKPRSIDLDRGLQHGFRPKIGYRSNKEIRDIHPSGYKEIRIENVNDLEKINIKENAIRISRTVGKRKRNEIVKKANEKGIWILN